MLTQLSFYQMTTTGRVVSPAAVDPREKSALIGAGFAKHDDSFDNSTSLGPQPWSRL